MENKADTLLFDLGNVIINLDINRTFDQIEQLCRPDSDRIVIDNVILKYECGKVSTEIFINTLLSQSYRDVQAIDIIEAWNSMLLDIPESRLYLLKNLKKKYKTFLLSNTNALHLEWVSRYLKKEHAVNDFDNEFFHKTYYSHLICDRKPLPSIFRHVIEDAPLNPSATLYMDDVQENLNTAQVLGFQTYLVKPGEEIGDYLQIKEYI